VTLRTVYSGTLHFPQGFHTGDGRRIGAVDQPLLRAADGRVALTGTSLAGVLRADLHRLREAGGGDRHQSGKALPSCRCVVCRLLGPEAPRERTEQADAALHVSKLYVSGGASQARPAVQVRDHVGIARRTRTAADQRKYDVEVAEGGLEVAFDLRADDLEPDERRILEAALKRLAGGWLFLGGKSSSGPGKAEVVGLTRHELDLGDRGALVKNLLADDVLAGFTSEPLVGSGAGGWADAWELAPAAAPTDDVSPPPADWAQLRLRFEIDFPWGFLVNSPPDALAAGFEHGYLRDRAQAPILPGSALRGALRSRAEQILRTLVPGDGFKAACDLHAKGAACHERIDRKNQHRKEHRQDPLTAPEERALHCSACRVFGSGRLASPVKVSDFQRVERTGEGDLEQDFVAVDRFTGGAATGLKFDAQARTGVTFAGEIHLELGPQRLEPWGLGLLALVVRDLLWGDLPLGFGSGKGFNEARVRLVGADRFWLAPPPALAGVGLDPAPGERKWARPEGIDDPAQVSGVAGEELARRVEEWVASLHAWLEEHPGSPPTDSDEQGEDAS
jgi:CRISPR/Cas system CSM-associated protein Csm3 (group 7 of RAMP superfamily)